MNKHMEIRITFPVPVDIPNDFLIGLSNAIDRYICEPYEDNNPSRIMWVFGMGDMITYIPMTPEDEMTRGLEFNETIFHIEVTEREAWITEVLRKRRMRAQRIRSRKRIRRKRMNKVKHLCQSLWAFIARRTFGTKKES